MRNSRLLAQLSNAGLAIEQHRGKWYVARVVNESTSLENDVFPGDINPYETPEDALVAAMLRLFACCDSAIAARNEAEATIQRLQRALGNQLPPEDEDQPPGPFKDLLG